MEHNFLQGFSAEELIRQQLLLHANGILFCLEQLARLRPELAERRGGQTATNSQLAAINASGEDPLGISAELLARRASVWPVK